MKILITGSSGFLGGAIAYALADEGHELGLLKYRAQVPKIHGARNLDGKLAAPDADALRSFAPDACVHAAWIATPGVYLEAEENRSLVDASLQFAERLAEVGTRHLIVLGSCAERAPDEGPGSLGGSLYARAKRALAKELLCASGMRFPKTSWLRVFHPYGPGEAPGRLPTAVARSLAAGNPFTLRSPDAIRDFVFVKDVAAAVCKALSTRHEGAADLGTGRAVTVAQLALQIAALLDVDPALIVREEHALDEAPLVADPAALHAIGWRPRTDLAKGLHHLVTTLGLNQT